MPTKKPAVRCYLNPRLYALVAKAAKLEDSPVSQWVKRLILKELRAMHLWPK